MSLVKGEQVKLSKKGIEALSVSGITINIENSEWLDMFSRGAVVTFNRLKNAGLEFPNRERCSICIENHPTILNNGTWMIYSEYIEPVIREPYSSNTLGDFPKK